MEVLTVEVGEVSTTVVVTSVVLGRVVAVIRRVIVLVEVVTTTGRVVLLRMKLWQNLVAVAHRDKRLLTVGTAAHDGSARPSRAKGVAALRAEKYARTHTTLNIMAASQSLARV